MRASNAPMSIRNLGVQLFPNQLDYFLEAYKMATTNNYGYLFIDLSATSVPETS